MVRKGDTGSLDHSSYYPPHNPSFHFSFPFSFPSYSPLLGDITHVIVPVLFCFLYRTGAFLLVVCFRPHGQSLRFSVYDAVRWACLVKPGA